MSARPRIALIGAGFMGSLHARVLAQSEECDLVRVIEPRQEIGQKVADQCGSSWSADFDFLADIDAVVIAAATEVHYDIAVRVLDIGKPLLVEKPIAETYQQTLALLDASRRRELPLICGLLERFNPAVLTAAQFVGDVVQVNAIRHSPFMPRIKTGVATDLLIHDADLAVRFAGHDPDVIKGSFGYFHDSSRRNRAEDSAEKTMLFRNGALATISASRISQRKIRQLSILEINRLIEIDLLRRDITIYRHVADSHTADGIGYQQQTIIEIPTIVHSPEPLAAQLSHFIHLLNADLDDIEAERQAIESPHRAIHEVIESAVNDRVNT